MEKAKKQIQDAIQKGAKVHGNRRSFQWIRDWGIEVSDGSRIVPWEEFVEKMFSAEQKHKALERVRQLPELPDLPLPSVITIYREILRCITFGTNGAAITLSSILVEFMLKFASFKIEMGGFQRYDATKWDEFERIELQKAIDRARENGLITDERKRSLEEFKNKYRNPYLHYNIRKITKDVVLRNVTRMNLTTGDSEIVDIGADSDPTIQPDAKRFVDDREVLVVFNYANDLVTEMWSKISHLE